MSHNNHIVEEHGIFWWSDEIVPDGHFAPDSAVSGILRIDEDGRIQLELNGTLPRPRGPLAVLIANGMTLPEDKGICGKLKTTDRSVLLLEVRQNGGSFKSAGISFERYFALHALVGRGLLQPKDHPLEFGKLQVALRGFEEWLVLRSIETKRTRTSVRVRYREPSKVSCPLQDGRISIVYDVSGPLHGTSHSESLELNELGLIEYVPRKPLSLCDMKAQYGFLSDLFILLTGSDYSLDWPTLTRGKKKESSWQFFFLRNRSKSEPPKLYECWTNFPQLKDRFGSVFSALREKQQVLGPGIYLYLGTMRAKQIYVEHRFVNLVWGIESLDRRKESTPEEPNELETKIKRILDQVKGSDKRWLQNQLRHAREPSLTDRMFRTLRALPLDLEEPRLRQFCEACAKRRNDISHFGGERQVGDTASYQAFLLDLRLKSEALSYLYQDRKSVV